ncbi:AAA domain-containing protein [Mycoplasma seminis]|uniref:AAA domain-containing protein n=1 Tax=Mycoplasma seminis TaxID=512749 RepID=A0ABY9H9C8_9MOLU|nr:AAA domain-containing protein [Mycoplasma seminis]WLP85187.1 AAA domain-containing protein [Mycoplasma seminis]
MFENILNKLLDTSTKNNLVKLKQEKFLEIFKIIKRNENPYRIVAKDEKLKENKNYIVTEIWREDEIAKLLNKFIKINSLSIEETGINLLNITFGSIKWVDRDKNELNSPLFTFNCDLWKEKDEYLLDFNFSNIEPNFTLIFKFKNEYGFDLLPRLKQVLDSIDNLDELEKEIQNLNSIVEFLPKSIKQDVSFEVNSFLGVFTYSKISIYNDLEQNKKKLFNSPFYKQLNGEASNFDFELISDKDIDEKIDYLDYYHCLDSDGSQEKAIQAAIQGHSFVLQGPPGTGKSQTISNIITELMSRGKKVLFVAEKTAAVDVVYNTLSAKGFDKFILRLHSDDNNTQFAKKLLSDYEQTKAYNKINQEFKTEMSKNISDYVNLINDYENILVDSETNKIPLFTLFNNYLEIKQHLPISESFSFPRSYDENEVRDICDILKNYQSLLGNFKNISNSKWFLANHSYEIDFNNLMNNLNTLKNNLNQINYLLGNSDFIFIKNNDLFKEIEKIKNIAFILTKTTWNKKNNFSFNDEIKYLKDTAKQYNKISKSLNASNITPSINERNIEFLKQWLKANSNGFYRAFSKKYKEQKAILKETNFNTNAPLLNYKQAKKFYKRSLKATKTFKNIANIIPNLSFEFNIEDIPLVNNLIVNFESLKNQFNDSEFIFAVNYTKEVAPVARSSFDNFQDLVDSIQVSYQELFKNFKVELEATNYFTIIDFINQLIKEQNSGYVILNKNNCELKLNSYGLESFLHFLQSGKYEELFVNTFKWAYANSNIKNILIQNNLAGDFVKLKDLHERYKKDLAVLNKNAYNNALQACCEKTPNFLGTEKSYLLLKAEAAKSRKFKSVKNIMLEASDAVLQMKRCLMMSPLSVSTYLKDSDVKFDVLIIDEASQIKTENALSSIFRADQYIICGDVEQLPPTNFFEEKVDLDDALEDDNIYDLDAYESILSAAASFLKSISLKWHYRSKYESLIYCSNNSVYNNSLVSFPNVSDKDPFNGLKFIYTKGIYEDKQNVADADATIKKLTQIIDKFGDRKSIGVITLNITMANYLEKQLNNYLKDNDKYKAYFSPKSATKFFIKNIENVQGDERDIILLVIGFGPNAQGKVSHNFGAINQAGGYKRLNVAVSRAKEAMFIISSLKFTDIDTHRVPARGVVFLKDILRNAELGITSGNKKTSASEAFKKEVQDALTSLGYQVHSNVGASDFKLDLAIWDPSQNKYVLGLECDGTTFATSKVAKDRDFLRSNVLEARGWLIYRIWSTDWFKNKDLELEQLNNFIKKHINSLGQVKPRQEMVSDENIIEQAVKTDFRDLFEPLINIKELKRLKLVGEKADYIKNNVDFISLKDLNNIVAKIYTNTKNISRILDGSTFKVVYGYAYKMNSNAKITFKLPFDNDKRDISNLHDEEWRDFLQKAKEFNTEINYDELAKIALELLGYKRISAISVKNVANILKDIDK